MFSFFQRIRAGFFARAATPIAALCLMLAGSARAADFSLTAADDGYVSNDANSGPNAPHAATSLHCRYFKDATGATYRLRVAFVRFNLTPEITAEDLVDAQLSLGGFNDSTTGAGGRTVRIYGVNESLDDVAPSTLTWATAPGVIGNGSLNTAGELEDRLILLDTADITSELTTMITPAINAVAFSSKTAAMDAFLNADTDGIITLMVTPDIPATEPTGASPGSSNGFIAESVRHTTLPADRFPILSGNYVGGSTGPLPQSLVKTARWPITETSGTTAAEVVGGLNATLVNFGAAPAWTAVDTRTTGSLFLDGVDDHLTVPNGPAVNFGTESFSISLLMKQNGTFTGTTPITENRIFSKGLFAATTGIRYEAFNKNGSITFSLDDGTVKTDCSVGDAPFVNNNWVHVVFVRNAETDKLEIWRNGELAASTTDGTTTGVVNTEQLVFGTSLASDKPATIGFFKGGLDDIRFYRTAMNSADIGILFATYTAQNAAKHWEMFE